MSYPLSSTQSSHTLKVTTHNLPCEADWKTKHSGLKFNVKSSTVKSEDETTVIGRMMNDDESSYQQSCREQATAQRQQNERGKDTLCLHQWSWGGAEVELRWSTSTVLASWESTSHTPFPPGWFGCWFRSQCLLWNQFFAFQHPKNWLRTRTDSRVVPTLCWSRRSSQVDRLALKTVCHSGQTN